MIKVGDRVCIKCSADAYNDYTKPCLGSQGTVIAVDSIKSGGQVVEVLCDNFDDAWWWTEDEVEVLW